jgi:hypothetical protein
VALSLGYHDAVSRAIPPSADHTVDLTSAVLQARRGFKSDVAALVGVLPQGRLFVPLMRRIEDVSIGVDTVLGDELSLSPHLLYDENRIGYVLAFTRSDLVQAAAEHVDLKTDGGALEYCALPASVVIEVALEIVDGERVAGLLVNPFHDSELILQRHELASIAQAKPIPLVGYVSDIPFADNEERLIAKLESPPPETMVAAIDDVLSRLPDAPSYELHRTFSPERDLEPHFTLNLVHSATEPNAALVQEIGAALEGKVPPPGYIDIVWNDPKLGKLS